MKHFKTLLTISLLLIAFSNLKAQTTYFHEFDHSDITVALHAAPLSENEQLITTVKRETVGGQLYVDAYIYKLNKDGIRIDSFTYTGNNINFFCGITTHNDLIYCLGQKYDSEFYNERELEFLCLDMSLNPLFSKTYKSNSEIYYPTLRMINDTAIGFSYTDEKAQVCLGFMFWVFNLEGDTIKVFSGGESNLTNVYDFAPKHDGSGIYITMQRPGMTLMTESKGALYGLNNDFQIVDTSLFQGMQFYNTNVIPYNSSQYLVAGSTRKNVFIYDNQGYVIDIITKQEFAIDKLDAFGNNIATCTPYEVQLENVDDSVFRSFFNCTVDYNDPNLIYGGFTKDAGFWSKNFMVFCCDSNLNVRWKKFINPKTNVDMYALIATKDGGVLVCGDNDYGNMSYCAFYMKIDSTGACVSTKELPFAVSNAAVYPNPGTVNMHVSVGPQILDGLFQVFDISGRLVLEQKISTTEMDINTSHWNKGTYVWRIIYKGKQVDEGKWIKQ